MNESKPTCGWNEAKPSFPPDDQLTESTDNTLVRAAVRIADLERERDEARAESARLREMLNESETEANDLSHRLAAAMAGNAGLSNMATSNEPLLTQDDLSVIVRTIDLPGISERPFLRMIFSWNNRRCALESQGTSPKHLRNMFRAAAWAVSIEHSRATGQPEAFTLWERAFLLFVRLRLKWNSFRHRKLFARLDAEAAKKERDSEE